MVRSGGSSKRCALQVAVLLAWTCPDQNIDQAAQAFRLCLQVLGMGQICRLRVVSACRLALSILSADVKIGIIA